MTQSTKAAPEQPAAIKAVANADLSDAIEKSMDKLPGEEVRTVRLFDDCYRCNWWMRDEPASASFQTSGKITRSQFLRATMTGHELVIKVLNSR